MLEGLKEWWENFSYSLEEKGIPSWALPLAVVILLVLAAFFLSSQSVPVGSVSVKILTASGEPIANANVVLEGSGDYSQTATTGVDGTASFSSVPEGNYLATVSAQDSAFPDGGRLSFSVTAGQESVQSVYALTSTARKVTISVLVEGPNSAHIQLLDSNGNAVDNGDALGDSASFSVEPNALYTIKASAEGFTAESLDVNVGDSDLPLKKVTLLPIGVEKNGKLYVGVFDDLGIDGTPLANASVLVFDSQTNNLIFTLSTSDAGTVEPPELPLGQAIRLVASAGGFERQSREATVVEETEEKFRLSKTFEPQGFFIKASDERGEAVENALVQLLSNGAQDAEGQTGLNGIASFTDADKSKKFDVIVFKIGFLPLFKERVSSGSELRLERSSVDNSGRIEVRILDPEGNAAGGAAILLADDNGKPLGIPARLSGVDGVQAFDGVPARGMMVVASKDGRVAKSGAFSPAKNGTTGVAITLPRTEGIALVRVSDRFSLSPISGAVVSLVNSQASVQAQCTTNTTGQCTAKILEGTVFAAVASNGFEPFQSAEFNVLPNALAKQDFALISSGAADAGLYFQGIFDLKGNKVKTLSPFATYNAKYLLVSGGLNFTLANAHIRVGGQDESLERLPAVISGFRSLGSVQKGVDYSSQSAAFVPASEPQNNGLQSQVFVTAGGFIPANVVVEAGKPVQWVSQDDGPYALAAEDGSFTSPSLARGASFSRTFDKQGVYYYRDSLGKAGRASITVLPKQQSPQAPAGQAQLNGLKWVDFTLPVFTGSREVAVQIKTVASSGKFGLQHRSAFNTAGGVLRKPEDKDAGSAKSELLANTIPSGVFEISSQGYCEKDYCLQYWFENNRQSNFEALYPDSFKLFVRVFSDSPSQLSMAGDDAVALQSIEDPQAGSSTPAQGSGASVSLTPQGGIADAFAIFAPKKLASDSVITLKVNNFQRQAHLRVVSKDKLKLVEAHSPAELKALQESKVSFTIKDSLGFPVEKALVTLNGVQAGETPTPGVYEAAITPDFVGSAIYDISKQGFPSLQGSLRVKAPAEFITLTPQAIQASISSSASSPQSQNSVVVQMHASNLVKNEVTLSRLRIDTAANPQYTGFSVSFTRPAGSNAPARLKPLEQKDFAFNASILPSVLPFAAQPRRLQEQVDGNVIFTFSLGGFTQEIQVPMRINTAFEQKGIDELWSVQQEELQFAFSPQSLLQQKTLRINSQSTAPLLVNLGLSAQGLTSSPAAAVLQPNSFVEFNITKTMPPDTAADCFARESQSDETLPIVISYRGLSSRKTVAVKSIFTQDSNCKPDEAREITLPFTTLLMLSKDAQVRENPDGTIALRVGGAGGELLAFDSPASWDAQTGRVTIPAGTRLFMPSSRVVQPDRKKTSQFKISFPIEARMEMPGDGKITRGDKGGYSVTLLNSIAFFPQPVVLGIENQVTFSVVPKNVFVELTDLTDASAGNTPIGLDAGNVGPNGQPWNINPALLSPIPYNAIPLLLPVELFMRFPAGSSLIDPVQAQFSSQVTNLPGAYDYYSQQNQNSMNLRGVWFPPDLKFAFSADASLRQASGSLIEAVVPQNTQFYLPSQYVQLGGDSVSITFPLPVVLRFPSNAQIVSADATAGRNNTVKVAEDTVVQFAFPPSFQSERSGFKSVLVPAFSPVVFVKGAAARYFEDPSIYSKCDFVITAPEDGYIDLPSSSVFEDGVAFLSACQQVSFMPTAGEEALFTSPSVKRITAPEGKYSGNGLFVSKGGKITFKVCKPSRSGGQNNVQSVSITVPEDSVLSLPPKTVASKSKQGEFTFSGGAKKILIYPKAEEGTSRRDSAFDVGIAEKITISAGADYSVSPNPDVEGRLLVSVPKGSKLSFVPSCKQSNGIASLKNPGSLKVEPTEISVTLSNEELNGVGAGAVTGTKTVLLKVSNPSSAEITVQGVDIEGSEVVKDAIGERKFFTATEAQSDSAKILPFAKEQHEFAVVFAIPKAAIERQGVGSCLSADFVSKHPSEKGKLVFRVSQDGQPGDSTEVSVELKFDLSKECVPQTVSEQTQAVRKGIATVISEGKGDPHADSKDFFFKNAGHMRFLIFNNNRAEPIDLAVSNPSNLVSLQPTGTASEFKGVLNAGDSILFTVTAKSHGSETLALTALRHGTQQALEATKFNVKVFTPPKGAENLYPSTPSGTLLSALPAAPATEPATTPTFTTTTVKTDSAVKFTSCETNYCSYDYALSAAANFLRVVQDTADKETNDLPVVRSICSNIGTTSTWKMSFILNLANARVFASGAGFEKDFKSIVSQMKKDSPRFQDIRIAQGAKFDFTGCGSYLIEAKLNSVTGGSFCAFDPTGLKPDQKKPLLIELSGRKITSCPVTVANAPLLMPVDDVMVVTGNEIIEDNTASKIFLPSTHLSSFPDLIEIGKYSEKSSEQDVANAQKLTNAMYSTAPNAFASLQSAKFVDSSKPFFDDPLLCKQNVHALNVRLVEYQIGGAAVATAIAIVLKDPKFSANIAKNLARSFIETQAICGVAKLQLKDHCTYNDFCTHVRFVTTVDAILSSFLTPFPTGKTWLSKEYLGQLATGSLATYFLASAEAPALYGGSTMAKIEGSAFKIFGGERATPPSPGTSSTTGRFIANAFLLSGGVAAAAPIAEELAAEAAGAAGAVPALYTVAAPAYSITTTSGYAPTETILAGGGTAAGSAAAEAGAATEEAVKGSAKGGLLSRIWAWIKNFVKGGSKAEDAAGKTVAAGRYKFLTGRFLGRFGALVALNLLTNVQSEPVEAIMGERVSNYVVAYHYDDKNFPSSSAYCYYPTSGEKCEKAQRVSLANECQGRDACLYLQPLVVPYATAQKAAGITPYALFFTQRKADFDSTLFFNSVFNPNSEPLFEGNGEVKVADKVGGPFAYSTAEQERAFDERAAREEQAARAASAGTPT